MRSRCGCAEHRDVQHGHGDAEHRRPVECERLCADSRIPSIAVDKTVKAGPTFDSGTGEYTISYDVVVENDGDGPGTYDLIEIPTFGDPTNINITSVALDTVPLTLPIANPIVDDPRDRGG